MTVSPPSPKAGPCTHRQSGHTRDRLQRTCERIESGEHRRSELQFELRISGPFQWVPPGGGTYLIATSFPAAAERYTPSSIFWTANPASPGASSGLFLTQPSTQFRSLIANR